MVARHARVLVGAVLAAALVMGGGCSGGGDGEEPPALTSSTAPPGTTPTVVLRDDTFQPADLTVAAGTTVVWEWRDGPRAHDVVAAGFSSDLKAGGTFEHRFEGPGTYDYSCRVHAGMDGTITVTPAS